MKRAISLITLMAFIFTSLPAQACLAQNQRSHALQRQLVSDTDADNEAITGLSDSISPDDVRPKRFLKKLPDGRYEFNFDSIIKIGIVNWLLPRSEEFDRSRLRWRDKFKKNIFERKNRLIDGILESHNDKKLIFLGLNEEQSAVAVGLLYEMLVFDLEKLEAHFMSLLTIIIRGAVIDILNQAKEPLNIEQIRSLFIARYGKVSSPVVLEKIDEMIFEFARTSVIYAPYPKNPAYFGLAGKEYEKPLRMAEDGKFILTQEELDKFLTSVSDSPIPDSIKRIQDILDHYKDSSLKIPGFNDIGLKKLADKLEVLIRKLRADEQSGIISAKTLNCVQDIWEFISEYFSQDFDEEAEESFVSAAPVPERPAKKPAPERLPPPPIQESKPYQLPGHLLPSCGPMNIYRQTQDGGYILAADAFNKFYPEVYSLHTQGLAQSEVLNTLINDFENNSAVFFGLDKRGRYYFLDGLRKLRQCAQMGNEDGIRISWKYLNDIVNNKIDRLYRVTRSENFAVELELWLKGEKGEESVTQRSMELLVIKAKTVRKVASRKTPAKDRDGSDIVPRPVPDSIPNLSPVQKVPSVQDLSKLNDEKAILLIIDEKGREEIDVTFIQGWIIEKYNRHMSVEYIVELLSSLASKGELIQINLVTYRRNLPQKPAEAATSREGSDDVTGVAGSEEKITSLKELRAILSEQYAADNPDDPERFPGRIIKVDLLTNNKGNLIIDSKDEKTTAVYVSSGKDFKVRVVAVEIIYDRDLWYHLFKVVTEDGGFCYNRIKRNYPDLSPDASKTVYEKVDHRKIWLEDWVFSENPDDQKRYGNKKIEIEPDMVSPGGILHMGHRKIGDKSVRPRVDLGSEGRGNAGFLERICYKNLGYHILKITNNDNSECFYRIKRNYPSLKPDVSGRVFEIIDPNTIWLLDQALSEDPDNRERFADFKIDVNIESDTNGLISLRHIGIKLMLGASGIKKVTSIERIYDANLGYHLFKITTSDGDVIFKRLRRTDSGLNLSNRGFEVVRGLGRSYDHAAPGRDIILPVEVNALLNILETENIGPNEFSPDSDTDLELLAGEKLDSLVNAYSDRRQELIDKYIERLGPLLGKKWALVLRNEGKRVPRNIWTGLQGRVNAQIVVRYIFKNVLGIDMDKARARIDERLLINQGDKTNFPKAQGYIHWSDVFVKNKLAGMLRKIECYGGSHVLAIIDAYPWAFDLNTEEGRHLHPWDFADLGLIRDAHLYEYYAMDREKFLIMALRHIIEKHLGLILKEDTKEVDQRLRLIESGRRLAHIKDFKHWNDILRENNFPGFYTKAQSQGEIIYDLFIKAYPWAVPILEARKGPSKISENEPASPAISRAEKVARRWQDNAQALFDLIESRKAQGLSCTKKEILDALKATDGQRFGKWNLKKFSKYLDKIKKITGISAADFKFDHFVKMHKGPAPDSPDEIRAALIKNIDLWTDDFTQKSAQEKVRILRDALNWPLNTLARRCCVGAKAINMFERSINSTTLANLIKLANAFCVEPASLLTGEKLVMASSSIPYRLGDIRQAAAEKLSAAHISISAFSRSSQISRTYFNHKSFRNGESLITLYEGVAAALGMTFADFVRLVATPTAQTPKLASDASPAQPEPIVKKRGRRKFTEAENQKRNAQRLAEIGNAIQELLHGNSVKMQTGIAQRLTNFRRKKKGISLNQLEIWAKANNADLKALIKEAIKKHLFEVTAKLSQDGQELTASNTAKNTTLFKTGHNLLKWCSDNSVNPFDLGIVLLGRGAKLGPDEIRSVLNKNKNIWTDDFNNKTPREKIKVLRDTLNWSAEKLGEYGLLGEAAIRFIEDGRSRLSLINMIKIANAFCIEPAALLKGGKLILTEKSSPYELAKMRGLVKRLLQERGVGVTKFRKSIRVSAKCYYGNGFENGELALEFYEKAAAGLGMTLADFIREAVAPEITPGQPPDKEPKGIGLPAERLRQALYGEGKTTDSLTDVNIDLLTDAKLDALVNANPREKENLIRLYEEKFSLLVIKIYKQVRDGKRRFPDCMFRQLMVKVPSLQGRTNSAIITRYLVENILGVKMERKNKIIDPRLFDKVKRQGLLGRSMDRLFGDAGLASMLSQVNDWSGAQTFMDAYDWAFDLNTPEGKHLHVWDFELSNNHWTGEDGQARAIEKARHVLEKHLGLVMDEKTKSVDPRLCSKEKMDKFLEEKGFSSWTRLFTGYLPKTFTVVFEGSPVGIFEQLYPWAFDLTSVEGSHIHYWHFKSVTEHRWDGAKGSKRFLDVTRHIFEKHFKITIDEDKGVADKIFTDRKVSTEFFAKHNVTGWKELLNAEGTGAAFLKLYQGNINKLVKKLYPKIKIDKVATSLGKKWLEKQQEISAAVQDLLKAKGPMWEGDIYWAIKAKGVALGWERFQSYISDAEKDKTLILQSKDDGYYIWALAKEAPAVGDAAIKPTAENIEKVIAEQKAKGMPYTINAIAGIFKKKQVAFRTILLRIQRKTDKKFDFQYAHKGSPKTPEDHKQFYLKRARDLKDFIEDRKKKGLPYSRLGIIEALGNTPESLSSLLNKIRGYTGLTTEWFGFDTGLPKTEDELIEALKQTNKDEFGKRLKLAREFNNMPQEELAKKIGYNGKAVISNLETGENPRPEIRYVPKFEEALGIEASLLLYGKPLNVVLKDARTVNERINILRWVRGLTYEALGGKLGVSEAMARAVEEIYKFELPTPYIPKLAAAFGVEPSILVYGKLIGEIISEAKNAGEIIVALRYINGWSTKDLAEKSGVSYWQIYGTESGKRVPSLDEIKKICEALNVSEDLFKDVEVAAFPKKPGRQKKVQANDGSPKTGPAANVVASIASKRRARAERIKKLKKLFEEKKVLKTKDAVKTLGVSLGTTLQYLYELRDAGFCSQAGRSWYIAGAQDLIDQKANRPRNLKKIEELKAGQVLSDGLLHAIKDPEKDKVFIFNVPSQDIFPRMDELIQGVYVGQGRMFKIHDGIIFERLSDEWVLQNDMKQFDDKKFTRYFIANPEKCTALLHSPADTIFDKIHMLVNGRILSDGVVHSVKNPTILKTMLTIPSDTIFDRMDELIQGVYILGDNMYKIRDGFIYQMVDDQWVKQAQEISELGANIKQNGTAHKIGHPENCLELSSKRPDIVFDRFFALVKGRVLSDEKIHKIDHPERYPALLMQSIDKAFNRIDELIQGVYSIGENVFKVRDGVVYELIDDDWVENSSIKIDKDNPELRRHFIESPEKDLILLIGNVDRILKNMVLIDRLIQDEGFKLGYRPSEVVENVYVGVVVLAPQTLRANFYTLKKYNVEYWRNPRCLCDKPEDLEYKIGKLLERSQPLLISALSHSKVKYDILIENDLPLSTTLLSKSIGELKRLIKENKVKTVKDFSTAQSPLSIQQKKALEFLACGDSREEIARKLNIKKASLVGLLNIAYRNLGVHAEREAIGVALNKRYITLPKIEISPETQEAFHRLTPKQKFSLRLMSEGVSNEKICKELGIKPGSFSVTNLCSALSVDSPIQAMVIYINIEGLPVDNESSASLEPMLTGKQTRFLELISQAFSDDEIAGKLEVDHPRLRETLNRIRHSLGLPDQNKLFARVNIVDAAIQKKLIPRPVFSDLAQKQDQSQRLSERQKEIIKFMCICMKDEQIAQNLGISKDTVRYDIDKIKAIFNVESRTQVVMIAKYALNLELPVLEKPQETIAPQEPTQQNPAADVAPESEKEVVQEPAREVLNVRSGLSHSMPANEKQARYWAGEWMKELSVILRGCNTQEAMRSFEAAYSQVLEGIRKVNNAPAKQFLTDIAFKKIDLSKKPTQPAQNQSAKQDINLLTEQLKTAMADNDASQMRRLLATIIPEMEKFQENDIPLNSIWINIIEGAKRKLELMQEAEFAPLDNNIYYML